MPKVLFSIAVHERSDVVVDMLNNINRFVPDCLVVLHVANNLEIFLEDNLRKNVFINSCKIKTGFMDGTLFFVHSENVRFACKNKLQFDYVCFFGSNQLFVKYGFSNYLINNHISSSRPSNISELDPQIILAKSDTFLSKMLPNYALKKCSPEGSVYRTSNIVTELQKFWSDETYNRILRVVYQTNSGFVLRKIFRNYSRLVRKYCPFFIDFLVPKHIRFFTYASEEVYFPTMSKNEGSYINSYCFIPWSRSTLNVTISDIKIINESDDYKGIFSVKRVNREYNDPVREYIRNL